MAGNMTIKCPEFAEMETIPDKFSCRGDNINPSLEFKGVPDNAESLVLILDDPDAPGGTFDHWIIWNIDPSTTEIEEDSVPSGAIQGINSFGRYSYGGPCPPSGTHRYFFKLYALDTTLNISSDTPKEVLIEQMEDHIIDHSELVGLFSKQ